MVCGAVRFCPRSASSRSWMPRRAAAHLEPAGQDALAREAAVDAVRHHRPEPGEAGVDLGRRRAAPARWRAAARRCAEPGRVGEREELGGAERNGMRHRRPVGAARRAAELARGQHEAAADGIVGLLQVQVAAPRPRPRARGRWRARAAAARSRRRGRGRRRRPSRAGRAGRRARSAAMRASASAARAASKSAGSKPARPRITARSVAWPLPVKARLPCSRQPSRAGAPAPGMRSAPSRSAARKRPAATIGPTVCEEEGPTPTLKMSKTLRNMGPH